jgi:heptosyltransferase-3
MAHSPKSILVFAKPAIGDILLATPLIRSIRQANPDATIDAMCYPGQEEILEGNADINNVLVNKQKPTLREMFATFCRMFRKYDIAITNAADDRAHLYLLVFGKTRISVSLKGGPAWKRWVVNGSVEDDSGHMHALMRNNHLGNTLGYESRYDIQVPRRDVKRFQPSALIAELKMAGPFAILHPDARLPYKRWTMNG